MSVSEPVQPESDIDELATQVNDLAASRRLALIPAIPLRGSAPGFVAEKAGGYPPSARLLEPFLDTPPLQSVKTGRH
jgi:hypothetical protein